MIARITPCLEDWDVSSENGFLPSELPLQVLPDSYYGSWEAIMAKLSIHLQNQTLRDAVDSLPVLSTVHLHTEPEWQRAYSILAFLTHSYIWGGEQPSQHLPAAISIPFLQVASHLELPPTATYAALNLWNFAPHNVSMSLTNPTNLRILHTFTGTRDEAWFLLISVAMEARCAPIIPTMLQAISAASFSDVSTVQSCLDAFAECASDLGNLLERMYEECDPYVFYNQIRPFLAGSKNMAVAGLPNGVFYDEGEGQGRWRQYSGGSNAQSSLIQFLDAALGVEHAATGEFKDGGMKRHGFLQEMRSYMPGSHARFLEHVTEIANIRAFVQAQPAAHSINASFNAAVRELAGFRDKHIRLVTRYIVLPSKNPLPGTKSLVGMNIATASTRMAEKKETETVKVVLTDISGDEAATVKASPGLYGTGGTQLIPFLKKTRDETRDTAVGVNDRVLTLLTYRYGIDGVR